MRQVAEAYVSEHFGEKQDAVFSAHHNLRIFSVKVQLLVVALRDLVESLLEQANFL